MNSLVVFGGFNVERDGSGRWCTTIHFARFLESLSEHFDKITFVTWEHPSPAGYRSVLGGPKIEVVALRGGLRNRAALIATMIRRSSGAHVWLHLPNAVSLFPGWPVIRRAARSVTVYLANDYVQFCEHSRYSGNPLGRSYFFAAHRRMLSDADQVIARGAKLAAQAGAHNSRVSQTVPIVRLPERHARQAPPDGESGAILFVGQMLWGKGLRELVTAYKLLRESGQAGGARLRLAGAGADLTAIQAFASSLLAPDDFEFLGWLDSAEDLERMWNDARLLVMPTSGYGEGVPRTIDEALSRCVPVVATRVGGVADEYQGGEVVLVEPGDANSLRDAIASVLTDPRLRANLRAAAQERVDRWQEFGDAGNQHAQIILGASNRRPR